MMKPFQKLAFYVVTVTLCFSCHFNKGKFVITNKSDFNIDSLTINPDSRKQIIKLDKGEHIEHSIVMNEAKTDGSYFITFKNSDNNTIVSKSFGYYTNGYQIEDEINITVLNDTILIESTFNKPYK
ncbi:hypothetical protein HNV10_15155 [Winogradskyella litoriviva]|uniref:Uncharacterized protein n=1 Tax=Winogradskyella litoriviva TaxID=1220182 RepID=A0ABX2E919_9FLAO|nr:hypothetical protein [Winogradskyella litoriviva]NRD24591.1 hypothetical protein [Winogradskyella litoriviva]